MSDSEAELDAVVDSILLARARSSSASGQASPPLKAMTAGGTAAAASAHASTVNAEKDSRSTPAVAANKRSSLVDSSIWHPAAKTSAPASVLSNNHNASAVKGQAEEREKEEEEDLNALVERILAGPGPAAPAFPRAGGASDPLHSGSHTSTGAGAVLSGSPTPSSLSSAARPSHGFPMHRGNHHPTSSEGVPSPSLSPTSSSPRYPLPPSQAITRQPANESASTRTSDHSSRKSSNHHHHHQHNSTGGAVRAEKSVSRPGPGGLSMASAASAGASPMDAVVRRLTLWQERREAKRVQSVYEALEREQEDCTFEPSINRLPPDDLNATMTSSEGRGRSVHNAYHTSAEEEEEGARTQEECRTGARPPPPPLPSGNRRASYSSVVVPASSYRSERGTEYVPSLLPPPQPIYGVGEFVERLRRAQEERDSRKAAEEEERLRHYDPTQFRRGVTVPEPFEFGDTRPRRLATATVPVPGVPSPLARLRVTASLVEGRGGSPSQPPLPVAAPTLSASPSRVSLTPSGGPVAPHRTPYAHTVGQRSPLDDVEDGYGAFARNGREEVYVDLDGSDGESGDGEEERMTAENTFLSLAPQIRESLLFDRQMEQQLRRATQSIRRGAT